jgi:hypothetical protein
MAGESVTISIPEDLIAEIDAEVGVDNRSAFLARSAREGLRRRRQLVHWLTREEPIWKDEDHADLAAMGTEAWVRQLREESDRSPALNPPYAEDEE